MSVACNQMYHREEMRYARYLKCGTQPIPAGRRWQDPRGSLAIPTKTQLTDSQLSGRWCLFVRVPFQVFRTRLWGRALHLYLMLFVREQSSSSLLLRIAISWFLTSCGSGILLCMMSLLSRSLLQHISQSMKAHSDMAMGKKQVAPGLGALSGVLIVRRGSAMIEVMLKPEDQLMFFWAQRALTVFHAWSHLLVSQLNRMCCIDSVDPQLWQIPCFSLLGMLDK